MSPDMPPKFFRAARQERIVTRPAHATASAQLGRENRNTNTAGMYLAVMLAVFVFLFSRPSCALAVAWAGLVTILACRLAQKHLGGMSGDVAGFSITLGEASALLILAVF